MLKTVSIDQSSGKQLAHDETPWGPMMMVVPPAKMYGMFQSATHTGAATTILARPPIGCSLILCDLVLSSEKIAGGIATVRFYDGATAENIIVANAVDFSVNLAWSPSARIQGWEDAYIDFTTSIANQDASCTISYIYISNEHTLCYSAWDALR